MNQKQHILFLSLELSGYFIACVQTLVNYNHVHAHIVRYPVNPTAPFKFKSYPNVTYYERNDYNQEQLEALTETINPSVIICSGWIDKSYLKICKAFKKRISTVLTLDNPWTGSLKQNIYSLFAPLYFKNKFTHVWVPGEEHKLFARKLGFNNENIIDGLYCADVAFFKKEYLKNKERKKIHFPHKILYVGRYTELKGVREMWQAFAEWKEEHENDWELWCLGKGELDSEFPDHPSIKNFGFVQPQNLAEYIQKCGVFILPSRIEHWGVVVHEYASAGFPLISNKNTAAANFFLKDKYNGFVHKTKDKDSLKAVFQLVSQTSDDDLFIMGERSVEIANKINTKNWSDTILKLIE